MIWFISECPHDVDIRLSQIELAGRPVDNIVLSCVIDGIARDQIDFFWWLKHENNIPLYTFSVMMISNE